MKPRAILAIAVFCLVMPGLAMAQDVIYAAQDDAPPDAPAVSEAALDANFFDGGVGGGPDLTGNGSMIQILQLQPSGGSAIAGSAAASRFATASAAAGR